MDEAVESSEALKEKDTTKISGKDSSMESNQGNKCGKGANKKTSDPDQETITVPNEDVVKTAPMGDTENASSAMNLLAHQEQELSSEKDCKGKGKNAGGKHKPTSGIPKRLDKPSSPKASRGRVYVCSFFRCSLWLTQDAESFKIHNLQCHPDVKDIPCAFCPETPGNVEAFIAHTDSRHMESKLLVFHRSYHCGFKDCWLACEKALDFLNHNQKVHAKSKSYPCCYCKQEFRTLAELVLHIDESVTYSCAVCPDIQKPTYTDIRKHIMQSPHGSKHFFATGEVDSGIKLNLKCLLTSETGVMKYKAIERYVYVEKPVQEGSPEKNFKCDNCSLTSSDEASFEAHVMKCTKIAEQKDNISLLRSARPTVMKNKIKDLADESVKKTTVCSRSNYKEKFHTSKATFGNTNIQNIESDQVDRRRNEACQQQMNGKDSKCIDVNSVGATSSKFKEKIVNAVVQPEENQCDLKEAEVENIDNSARTSMQKKRKRQSLQDQPYQKKCIREDNLVSPDQAIADKNQDRDQKALHKVDPPPDIPPSPVKRKGVLENLGKGQLISCEKCSFETELRVVKSIHEHVHLQEQDKLKLLWCPHCAYSTNKLLHFKIHVKCHKEKTKMRLYNCGHCLLSSNKIDLIDDHHEEVHTDLELKSEVTRLVLDDLECFQCTVTLKTEVEFLEHVEQHHSETSVLKHLKDMYGIASLTIIDDDYGQNKRKVNMSGSETHLRAKISECTPLETNRFQCSNCDYSCHMYQPWAEHIVRSHKSVSHKYIIFSCGLCKWKSTVKAKLVEHCKMKHDELKVVEQTLQLAQINVEIEKEVEQIPDETSCQHHCDFCSFRTHLKAELVEHWSIHEGQTLSSMLSSDEEDAIDMLHVGATYEKEGASNKNKDTERLINDMILNLKHDKAVLSQKGSCPLCPFTSKVRNDLVKHLNFHKKAFHIKDGFQCGYCVYMSEFEGVLTKHMKRDHPNLPLKKKIIGNASLKSHENATDEPPCYIDQKSPLQEQKASKDTSQDKHSEESGINIPGGIDLDECMSGTGAAENSNVDSTDFEDMPVGTKRFRTRSVNQEKEGKSHNAKGNVLSSLEDYFTHDGKKLEYTEDILCLLNDMILNIQQSERGNYTGTLICPICPYTSPDKCVLRMHLQSHRSQASITHGYRCSYCLYTSEKLFSITRHQSQLHPRLPKKKICIGNAGKAKAARQNRKMLADVRHHDDSGFSGDSPGFTISAAIGSDGSIAVVDMNLSENDSKSVEENHKETAIVTGVSSETEDCCRSLYCCQDLEKKSFQCKKCPFVDDDPRNVYNHFRMQHKEDCPFQCGYCEYQSVAVMKISQHCEVSHSGLPVKISPVIAGSNSKIAVETNSQTSYNHVSYIAEQNDGLSTYMIDCGDNVFMCSICGYENSGRQDLRMHLLVSHLNDYPYKCQHCEFASTESNQIQKHVDEFHSNLDQMIVQHSPSALTGHRSVMIKEETQLCISSAQLVDASEANKANFPERNDKSQQFSYEHKFRCELCNYSTKWAVVDVKHHVLNCHLNLRRYNCQYCSFGSRMKTVLGAHYRSSHRGMPGDPTKDWDAVQEALTINEDSSGVYVGISENANVVMMTYKPNLGKKGKSSRPLKKVEALKAAPDPPADSGIPMSSVHQSGDAVTVSGSMVLGPSTLAFTSEPGPSPIVIQPHEPANLHVLHDCNGCNSRYADKEEAQYHVMVHHLKLDPYMCSRCRFGSMVEREVIAHSELEHPGEQISLLPSYKENLVVQEYLVQASVTAEEYQKASGKPDKQLKKTSRLIPCSMCRDKLPNSEALIDHMAAVHVDYTGFTCCYCATFIKAKPQMRTHFQSKHPDHQIQYKKVKDGVAYGKTLNSFPTATWMRNKIQNIGFANLAKRKLTTVRGHSLKEKKYGMPNQKKTSQGSVHEEKTRQHSKFSKMRKKFAVEGSTVELHCKHCSYTTTSLRSIKDHIKRHLQYKPFKCGHCQRASFKKKTVVSHSHSVHKDLPVVVNKVVDPAVLASLTNHFRVEVKHGKQQMTQRSVDNLAVSDCVQNTPPPLSQNTLPTEQQHEENTVSYEVDHQLDTRQCELFTCVLCGEEKDNRSNLMQHIMLELNYRPWSCPHCEFRDVTLHNIKSHCLHSHPGKPFRVVIQKDAERMAKIQALVERSRVSLDEGLIQDASQQSVVDVKRNMDLPFNNAAIPVKEEQFKPFSCSYCSLTACNLSELSEHMVQDHPGMRPLNVFSLDERHQSPNEQQEPVDPSSSQAAPGLNRVSLESSVHLKVIERNAAIEDLNTVITDSSQDGTEKFLHSSLGPRMMSSPQGCSLKPRTENSKEIGKYDGVVITDKHLIKEKNDDYSCRECTFSASRSSAVGHYVRCHMPMRWKCPYCEVRYTITHEVRRHCKKMHPGLPVNVVLVDTSNVPKLDKVPAPARPVKRSATSSKPGPASSKKQKPNPTNLPSVFCCYLCTFKTDNTLKLVEHQKQHAK